MNDHPIAAVFTNPERDPDFSYTRKVVRTLLACDIEVCVDRRFRYSFGEAREDVEFYTYTEEMLRNADIIVVLGGDGSILDICEKAATHDLPVLGINLGHLGFLTSLEKDDIKLLSEFADGNYTVEERMMADVKIIDCGISHELHALNDIVVTSGARAKIADFCVSCDDSTQINVRADGVIVATPTGSTAYSLSAGGPVIDPKTELFCLTPVCPHSLTSRPIVFSGNSVISVSGKTHSAQTDIYVAPDGRNGIQVSEKAVIEIKKSELKTKLVRIGNYRFFDTLSKKMYGI